MRSASTRILAILALSAGPAFAGAVYIPVIPSTAGGVTFTPQVVVGNSAAAKRTITQFFIPQLVSGIPRTPGPQQFDVLAGDTVLATVSNQVGLIEFSGAPEMMVSATMFGTSANGEVVNLPLPVITSSIASEEGDALHLLGLRRDAETFSNVFVVNLAKNVNTCSVKVLDATGATLLSASTLTVQPLTMAPFLDALAAVTGGVSAGRAEVVCAQSFYAFATVHTQTANEVSAGTIIPAGTGSSSLTPPGQGGNTGNCSGSAATKCYNLPGLVFAPARGANQKRVTFGVPQGSYDKVRLRMDVFYGGQNSRNPSGLHQFFWMAINSKNPDLLGFTSVRSNNKELMLRTGIGNAADQKSKIIKAFSLVKGETYFLDYIYGAAARDIVWHLVERSTGKLVASVFDSPNVRAIQYGSDGHMAVDLSMSGENPDEPPSWGWKYSDIIFEIFD